MQWTFTDILCSSTFRLFSLRNTTCKWMIKYSRMINARSHKLYESTRLVLCRLTKRIVRKSEKYSSCPKIHLFSVNELSLLSYVKYACAITVQCARVDSRAMAVEGRLVRSPCSASIHVASLCCLLTSFTCCTGLPWWWWLILRMHKLDRAIQQTLTLIRGLIRLLCGMDI